ncbi:MAG: sigma-54 dependent transcriptional regulator [Pseudomonadota bacterium]
MSKPDLLLVDDDPLIRESLEFLLRDSFNVQLAETREAALALINNAHSQPALALIDLGLPPHPHEPSEGFALVRELLARSTGMRIMVLSGQSDRENVRHAMSIGAADFIPKPCDPDLLKSRLQHQMLLFDAAQEQPGRAGDAIEGNSPAMLNLRAQIKQFANAEFPVTILGESGTGKELIADQMHRLSKRAGEPYIAVNCAAFSSELLASQLFGHAKGAFTGAARDHDGFFEAAGEGTLFLDEISEMSVELQSNLLRVIENGEYFRVGESTPRRSRVRLIAASNRDLVAEVEAGRFRQDLYYRMSVLNIATPPLRDRGEDRLTLLEHFQFAYQDTVARFTLDDEARQLWMDYHFPGNVRELRNIVIRLGTKFPGEMIGKDRLRDEFEHVPSASGSGAPIANELGIRETLRSGDFSLDDHVQVIEWEYIRTAMEMTDGNLSRTAKLLNVNRTTLYSKIQRLEEKFE